SDFTVNLGDDKTLCDVGTTQLTANIDDANPGNASFQWSGPSGAIPQNTQTITVSETGTYHVDVQIDNCMASADVQVDFQNSPNFDLGPNRVLCNLEDLVLDATPTNVDPSAVTYMWTYNGNSISESGPQVQTSNYGFGIYTVSE